ncbi:hypothetical protein ACIBKY_24735 [Nonomuraea sp. NPDC050394]|uniref:hypothetical protein n=1 Tax=Nonomuraea sp. NPDC050394 TaxID=3364363 RepID=UPI0037981FC6
MNGTLVIGFGFALEPEPWGRGNDRLLLAGDEGCEEPPPRTLPSPSDEENGVLVERRGPHATLRLRPDQVVLADDVAPRLTAAVDGTISRSSRDGDLIRSLIDVIGARHHAIWLVGGGVRDLLADTSGSVNDLDFCGTMLLGELYEIAGELMALAGLGDHRVSVSPGRVFSVAPHVGGTRILEYKALSIDGFHFPASGGDLLDDVVTRDLTVNGIYYDLRRQLIADPSGKGIEHLRAVPRKIAPLYREDHAVGQAKTIVRSIKFKLRWPDADVSEMTAWVDSLPGDLTARIPGGAWPALRGMWRRCVPEERQAEAAATARQLGSAADSLARLLQKEAPWSTNH